MGTLVRVSPWDDLQYFGGPDKPPEFFTDRDSFVMRVEGWLTDGHIHYGLFGPVLDGPCRYSGLLCSLIVRVDGCDWRSDSCSSAKFKVGPNVVVHRRYEYGAEIAGFLHCLNASRRVFRCWLKIAIQ